MRNVDLQNAQAYIKRSKHRSIWNKFVRAVAGVVVFCTTYALILPAITLETTDALCGLDHVHDDTCFVGDPAAAPAVPVPDLEGRTIHSHNEFCFDSAGNLICPIPELTEHRHTEQCYEIVLSPTEPTGPAATEPTPEHVHSDACYISKRGALACTYELPEVHTHTDACYEPVVPENTVPAVPEETVPAHTHTDTCYSKEQGALICELAEEAAHTHTDDCYTISAEPACGQEAEEHVHTDACYSKTLSCELPESDGHTHGDDCYEWEQKLICDMQEAAVQPGSTAPAEPERVLICTKDDQQIHIHGSDCYAADKILTCALPEDETHSHTESCYERTLICQLPGIPEHQHHDACYEWEKVLSCGVLVPDEEGSVPSDAETVTEPSKPAASEKVLVCTKFELSNHNHVEACYGTSLTGEVTLLCSKYQLKVHQHTETCLGFAPENLICQLEENEEHQHTHHCYSTWTFLCQNPAGTGLESDPTADDESPEDWEATFSHVQLTGDWSRDVLAIARTQLGYRESERNFVPGEDEATNGYTRYGDWYGFKYGDWCAMFASFCLYYAQVEDFPLNASCERWVADLKELEMFAPAPGYIPRPGDLIFFQRGRTCAVSPENPGISNHVGLVTEVTPATAEQPAMVHTIEGNLNNCVARASYELDDFMILGYGIMPDNPALICFCGMEEHTHEEGCWDEEGSLICEIPEHLHDASCRNRTLVYTDDTVRVDVILNNGYLLPEDLSLQVEMVCEDNQASYSAMLTAVGDAMYESNCMLGDLLLCRMKLLSEGEPYLLPEDVQAQVQVAFMQPVFSPEAVADAAELRTFVLYEEEPVETIEEEIIGTVQDEPMMFAAESGETQAQPEEQDTNGYVDSTLAGTYQAVANTTEDYSNTQDGVTGLSFSTNQVSTFAVALASTSQEGGFWKRVTGTSELSSGGIYMIVSPEGTYALAGNSNANAVRVNLDMVKGNPGYYTITDDNGADVTNAYLQWQFTGSGNSYTIYNTGARTYLNMSTNTLLASTSANIALSYQSAQGTWVLSHTYRSGWWNNTYYLGRSGTANFSRSTNSTAYTREVMIFRLEETTLTIPDDVISGSSGGNNTSDIPDKPHYAPYIGVTGGLAGNTTHGNVQGKYYSDPATSQVESLISGNTEDDGKVLTDKSVIYGDDDYGAFDSYDPNTFGVTLSALGQEYLVKDKQVVETPIDVVFVLDVSGSMQTVVNGKSRAQAMVDAVNTSMKDILEQNENNRVGVVIYSSGAWDLLELGRYSQTNDQYLRATTINDGSWKNGRYQVLPATNLQVTDESGRIHSVTNADQANGTYTQAGIAMGAAMLRRATPKTYTAILGEGTDYEQSVTVRRQPVMILLSDGEPTHCTSNYKDVLSGPHYGDGVVSADYQGVYGYYTILSANYYKRMISIAYNYPTLFYTVGMGISENQDVDLSGNNHDSDVYKRAVLNPTASNINNLRSNINPTNTVNQLKALMLNTFTGKQVTVPNSNQSYMGSWMGQVHASVPVLKNPYAGNYSYAEKAYFGQIGESELDSIFGEILESSMRVNSYGFILQSRSAVEMIDPIGAGMEVKGDPILRYGGVNYTHTAVKVEGNKKTYVYDYVYNATDGSRHSADLKYIVVEVITDENGLQTVHMDIPDLLLPAYSPYLYDDAQGNIPFYYEALPARLIYQVGLTEQAQADVALLEDYGGELTYYTNRYEDVIANALMKPTNANPYYQIGSENDHDHGVDKTQNLTETDLHSFECHHDRKNYGGEVVPWITQELGNNGKLQFEAPRKVVDIPVEKQWDEAVRQELRGAVTINLYSVVDDVVQLVDIDSLSSENQWKTVFDRLPTLENGFYAIAEAVPAQFAVSYGGETTTVTINGKPTVVAVISGQDPVEVPTVIVTNSNAYYLPETGGSGTHFYTLGGSLLLSAAALMYISIFGRKRKKGGG